MGTNSNLKKLTDADISFAKTNATKAVEYYRNFGLSEAKSRATNLALSGLTPLVGMFFFEWTTLSMLAFLVVDAVITVVADCIRFPIAKKWIKGSHNADHRASRVLLIIDALEDGTGERADTGDTAPHPGLILFFGIASTLFLVPIIAAATEHSGISELLKIANERSFKIAVLIDAAWRLFSALYFSISVRLRNKSDEEELIFIESGSVAVLYAGLLILIWLPIKFGAPGLAALFIILYLFKMGFGIFALIWMPRAIKRLEKRIASGDYSVAQPQTKVK